MRFDPRFHTNFLVLRLFSPAAGGRQAYRFIFSFVFWSVHIFQEEALSTSNVFFSSV
jgi:hypothetical protein